MPHPRHCGASAFTLMRQPASAGRIHAQPVIVQSPGDRPATNMGRPPTVSNPAHSMLRASTRSRYAHPRAAAMRIHARLPARPDRSHSPTPHKQNASKIRPKNPRRVGWVGKTNASFKLITIADRRRIIISPVNICVVRRTTTTACGGGCANKQ